jgi:hypothetical protein
VNLPAIIQRSGTPGPRLTWSGSSAKNVRPTAALFATKHFLNMTKAFIGNEHEQTAVSASE